MKPTTSILAILVASFTMGCQDRSITDPITTAGSEELRLSKTQPVLSLALSATLREPGNVHNSFVEVTGVVAYQTTVVPLDPIPPNPQHAVRMNLATNAALRPYNSNGPVWSISGSSEDWVPIPESGTAFLAKRYQIEGRNDGTTLILNLRITLTSVELTNMWLELPRVLPAANQD